MEAIIFDIGNVLLNFDFAIAYRRLAPNCDHFSDQILLEVERLKTLCESGGLSRHEFQETASKVLGFRGEPADFASIWQEIFHLNQPMVDFAESMKARYPLFLLSNTSEIHLEYILQEYAVFGIFKDAVYSHEAGLAKPEPAIFFKAIERFGVDPKKTIYIDDLLANIESAQSVGLQAIHYDPARHEQFLATVLPQLIPKLLV